MQAMILVLLLQAAILDPDVVVPEACKATTDIPEMKAGISRACRPGLISIDISGDHDTLTETLVLDKDFSGRDLSDVVPYGAADGTAGMTKATLHGFHAAMESARILEPIYHSRRFIWRVRDRENRAICHFTVEDEQTVGRCAEVIE